ncbi:hypothetical protein ACFL43_00430 [Thermodesulfobacteriota bacterium]
MKCKICGYEIEEELAEICEDCKDETILEKNQYKYEQNKTQEDFESEASFIENEYPNYEG